MPDETVQDQLRQAQAENALLKRRLLDFEQRMNRSQTQIRPGESTHVVKLLEQKDRTLEQYAQDLRQRTAELEKRKDEVHMMATALRMYGDLMENEASAILGLNRDARLILYNASASRCFGSDLSAFLYKEIDVLDFSRLDPYTPVLVRDVLSQQKGQKRTIANQGRPIVTDVHLMGSEGSAYGVIVKISA